jgi:hypothetical protein
MSKAVAHIVGMPVVVQGHLCRQRCAWCGAVLVDVDLAQIAVAGGSGEYNPFWETNAVLEVEASDDGSVVRGSIVLGPLAGVLPDNACTPLRPRALKLVQP